MTAWLAYLCPLSLLLLVAAAFLASVSGFRGRGASIAGYLLLAAIVAAVVFLATVGVRVIPPQR